MSTSNSNTYRIYLTLTDIDVNMQFKLAIRQSTGHLRSCDCILSVIRSRIFWLTLSALLT